MRGAGNKTLHMRPIKMVDLSGQYHRMKSEMDAAIQQVLEGGDFIQGAAVKQFESELSEFLGGAHVVSTANGTDALQIAMMALGFKAGDQVILPVHTYVATAEVIALLGLDPLFVDVDRDTFNIDVKQLDHVATSRTVAVVPVHLYGQCAEMEPLLDWAQKKGVAVIEDAAQSLGAACTFRNGDTKQSGTMGRVGATSFFPTKNLGAYGDGGALITTDPELADRLRMIANHGQRAKYHHEIIGVNSRLDTLQAAILSVKLKHLGESTERRANVAAWYDRELAHVTGVQIPVRAAHSSHVFHQYTLIVKGGKRDGLRKHLQEKGIPSMVYYPVPLHHQPAYRREGITFPVTEELSNSVLSLPIHTEMDEEQLAYICRIIQLFLE